MVEGQPPQAMGKGEPKTPFHEFLFALSRSSHQADANELIQTIYLVETKPTRPTRNSEKLYSSYKHCKL